MSDMMHDGDLATPTPHDLGGHDLATSPLVAARPYELHVPPGYDASRPTPLVVMLHGYASSGAGHEGWFHFIPLADTAGFLYAYPDGTKDLAGQRFWNATDACCNLFHSSVDDVAYLDALLDDVEAKYDVDPKRVFLVGHSNGAFMALRMACESSTRIAAIVAYAGDDWKDVAKCKPSVPVAVLQIHGDADQTIHYNGGQTPSLGAYPSAADSVAGWAKLDGCGATAMPVDPAVDVTSDIAGAETTRIAYPGCASGGAAELWTVHGGPHQPTLAPDFTSLAWQFRAAHARN